MGEYAPEADSGDSGCLDPALTFGWRLLFSLNDPIKVSFEAWRALVSDGRLRHRCRILCRSSQGLPRRTGRSLSGRLPQCTIRRPIAGVLLRRSHARGYARRRGRSGNRARLLHQVLCGLPPRQTGRYGRWHPCEWPCPTQLTTTL